MNATQTTVADAVKLCDEALRAIDALATAERFTPFSKWYSGDHAKARSAARKAVKALYTCGAVEEKTVDEWLDALARHSTRPGELRMLLAGRREADRYGQAVAAMDALAQHK